MPQPRHEELFLSAKEREDKLRRMRKEQEMREKKANDFKPKITQKSRDMVHKRMTECTFQSASQMKKVQIESLSSTLLSNMAADKNGRMRRNNTSESVE